jgi:hypothetical protein
VTSGSEARRQLEHARLGSTGEPLIQPGGSFVAAQRGAEGSAL